MLWVNKKVYLVDGTKRSSAHAMTTHAARLLRWAVDDRKCLLVLVSRDITQSSRRNKHVNRKKNASIFALDLPTLSMTFKTTVTHSLTVRNQPEPPTEYISQKKNNWPQFRFYTCRPKLSSPCHVAKQTASCPNQPPDTSIRRWDTFAQCLHCTNSMCGIWLWSCEPANNVFLVHWMSHVNI